MRQGLDIHISSQHGQFVTPNSRNSLEEGSLPGLQLDEFDAFERFARGVDSLVLHFHEFSLNHAELPADAFGDRHHDNHDDNTRQRRPAQLCLNRSLDADLLPQKNQRADDLEGRRPDHLDVSEFARDENNVRGSILEFLTIHLH